MSKITTFDNGLRLITEQLNGMYSCSLGVWVGAGSSDESKSNNGISHFIEHMLFKGTKTRSAFDITDEVDRIGAQINAFTSKECTCYYAKSIAQYVEKCFDVLSDMLVNSTFSPEEIDKERGVVLEEISMVEDTPEDICVDELATACFGEHALGMPIIGRAENIKSFTRQDILDYMSKMYTPDNIVISVAGNFDEQQIIGFAKKYFADKLTNACGGGAIRAKEHRSSSKLCHKFKQIEQAHVAIAFKSLPYATEGIEKDTIIASVFGGGMSSRLFQTVREKKGLAYSVYSYISNYKNNGNLILYAGTNPKNIEDCVKTIREEIDKLVAEGITKSEFDRAKAQLTGTFQMSQEQTATVMNMCGKYLLMAEKTYNIKEKLKHIEDVTYEDVLERLKSYFDFSSVCCSYVGPKVENYDFIKYFAGPALHPTPQKSE